MAKSAQAFRSIGEVARLIGVAPHVLRYWESQFPQLSPVKRPDGRRYYRPADLLLAAGLCAKLREEGLTIRGAKRLMAQDRGASIRAAGLERLGAEFAGPDGAAPSMRPHSDAPSPWLARLSAMAERLRSLDAVDADCAGVSTRLRLVVEAASARL